MPLKTYLAQVYQHCPKLSEESTQLLRQGLQVRYLKPKELFLTAGEASYCEEYMSNGVLDGVAVNEVEHKKSTVNLRELCRRKPTITQFAHDEKSEYRLANKIFTEVPAYKR
nr:hypothetical protein [uncultured Haemophilus sp.]